MFEYVFFDLDGTLTDPAQGITNSVIYTLEKSGLQAPKREELLCFIGPPLMDSFMGMFAMTRDEAMRAIGYYREYYTHSGIYENKLYKGIPELLDALCRRGHRAVLATSKPEQFAIEVLEHFGIDKYFAVAAGANMDETRTRKDEVIREGMLRAGVRDAAQAVMTGDRSFDVIGARICGMPSIGVLWGYGSAEELKEAGAQYIAHDVADILRIARGEAQSGH